MTSLFAQADAGLPDDVLFLWWLALGIALFVVVPVVVLLLHRLLRSVDRTERAVVDLWNTATTVARNTATTWQLGGTGDALDALKAEALRHDALLDAAGRPVDASPSAQATGGRP
jgi:hypothetical protein